VQKLSDAAKEYRLLGIRLDGRDRSCAKRSWVRKLQQPDFSVWPMVISFIAACLLVVVLLGIITKELDGCYVSSEFPMFVPVPGKVDIKFLKYWFRLPA